MSKNAPKVVVKVTNFLIDTAIRSHAGTCMFAMGIREAIPGACNVSVDIQTIRFSDKERRLRYIYLTPRLVQEKIIAFDEGQHIDPFTFILRGGQVSPMGSNIKNRDRLGGGAVVDPEKIKAEVVRARKKAIELKKKQLYSRDKNGTVTVLGGKSPPQARLSMRREYGLRGFKRRFEEAPQE